MCVGVGVGVGLCHTDKIEGEFYRVQILPSDIKGKYRSASTVGLRGWIYLRCDISEYSFRYMGGRRRSLLFSLSGFRFPGLSQKESDTTQIKRDGVSHRQPSAAIAPNRCVSTPAFLRRFHPTSDTRVGYICICIAPRPASLSLSLPHSLS